MCIERIPLAYIHSIDQYLIFHCFIYENFILLEIDQLKVCTIGFFSCAVIKNMRQEYNIWKNWKTYIRCNSLQMLWNTLTHAHIFFDWSIRKILFFDWSMKHLHPLTRPIIFYFKNTNYYVRKSRILYCDRILCIDLR